TSLSGRSLQPLISVSANPAIDVSGVRSSWLTIATKSFLIECASSAACSARLTRRLALTTSQIAAPNAARPATNKARLTHSGIGSALGQGTPQRNALSRQTHARRGDGAGLW